MGGARRRGGAHAAVREHRLPWWARRALGAGLAGGLAGIAWAGACELGDPTAPWNPHAAPVARAQAAVPPLVAAAPPVVPVVHTVVAPPGIAGTAMSRSDRAARSLVRLAGQRADALGRLAAEADEHADELLERQRREALRERELAALAGLPPMADGSTAWVRPVGAYVLTARFGDAGRRWSSTHTGLDFAAPTGTPVVSVDAGTVTFAGTAGAYGSKVEVTHADGTVTWYAHLSLIAVTEGQEVLRGGAVGTVGATGNTSGPHLHFEVRPAGGGPIDPVAALLARGVVL